MLTFPTLLEIFNKYIRANIKDQVLWDKIQTWKIFLGFWSNLHTHFLSFQTKTNLEILCFLTKDLTNGQLVLTNVHCPIIIVQVNILIQGIWPLVCVLDKSAIFVYIFYNFKLRGRWRAKIYWTSRALLDTPSQYVSRESNIWRANFFFEKPMPFTRELW